MARASKRSRTGGAGGAGGAAGRSLESQDSKRTMATITTACAPGRSRHSRGISAGTGSVCKLFVKRAIHAFEGTFIGILPAVLQVPCNFADPWRKHSPVLGNSPQAFFPNSSPDCHAEVSSPPPVPASSLMTGLWPTAAEQNLRRPVASAAF